MANLRNRRLATLTKNAKSDIIKSRILKAVIFSTFVIFIAGFIAVSLYNNNGAFTISVMNGREVKDNGYSLSLSETENFAKPTAILNAQQFPDMSNMAGVDLPNNLDDLGGGVHSKTSQSEGLYFYAYTFYLQNSGENTADYRYSLYIKEATKNLEKCIRIKFYINGESEVYAYPRTKDELYNGVEPGTTPFMSASTPITAIRETFTPGEVDRFTVVMWIEGPDPDTVNDVLGGFIRLSMRFEIIEK